MAPIMVPVTSYFRPIVCLLALGEESLRLIASTFCQLSFLPGCSYRNGWIDLIGGATGLRRELSVDCSEESRVHHRARWLICTRSGNPHRVKSGPATKECLCLRRQTRHAAARTRRIYRADRAHAGRSSCTAGGFGSSGPLPPRCTSKAQRAHDVLQNSSPCSIANGGRAWPHIGQGAVSRS